MSFSMQTPQTGPAASREKLVQNDLKRATASKQRQKGTDDRRSQFLQVFQSNPPRPPSTMRFLLALLGLLASVVSVSATALTTQIDAHEKSCFYTQVDEASLKIAFYFAVCGIAAENCIPFLSSESLWFWLICTSGRCYDIGPIRRSFRYLIHRKGTWE